MLINLNDVESLNRRQMPQTLHTMDVEYVDIQQDTMRGMMNSLFKTWKSRPKNETCAVKLARQLDVPIYSEYVDEAWFDHATYAWYRRHSKRVPPLECFIKDDEDKFLAVHDLQVMGKDPNLRMMLCSESASYTHMMQSREVNRTKQLAVSMTEPECPAVQQASIVLI